MDLDRFFRLMSDYIDAEIEAAEREFFEEFIEMDECCKGFLNTFEETVERCHCLEEEVPEEIHISFRETIMIRFEEEWE